MCNTCRMKMWVTFLASLGTALLAHVPCCGTAVLLAIGGASVSTGFLAHLAPYKDALTALSLAILAAGFVLAYRTPKACAAECDDKTPAHRHAQNRPAKIAAVWVAAILTAVVYAAPAAGLIPRHARALTTDQTQSQSAPETQACADPDCGESH